MQFYRYFVSQSSEFYRYNPLCCYSINIYFVRNRPETFGYAFVHTHIQVNIRQQSNETSTYLSWTGQYRDQATG